VELQARRDAALRLLEAEQKKRAAEQQNAMLEMQAKLAELAENFKDIQQKQQVRDAVAASKAGDISELVKLTKKYQDLIQRRREAQRETPGEYFLGFMRDNIRNLPWQAGPRR
jgi:hypothetical protein